MLKKRAAGLAVASFAALAGSIFAAPSPASAVITFETNIATSSSTPTGSLRCTSITGAKACFKADGDVWYVLDTAADGASAQVTWSNFEVNDDSELYRFGECVNKLGSGEWGVCNKDYKEGSRIVGRLEVYDYGSQRSIRTGPDFTFQS